MSEVTEEIYETRRQFSRDKEKVMYLKSRSQLYKYRREDSRPESSSAQKDQITLAYKLNMNQHYYVVIRKGRCIRGIHNEKDAVQNVRQSSFVSICSSNSWNAAAGFCILDQQIM